jgi:hypothetical protein
MHLYIFTFRDEEGLKMTKIGQNMLPQQYSLLKIHKIQVFFNVLTSFI